MDPAHIVTIFDNVQIHFCEFFFISACGLIPCTDVSNRILSPSKIKNLSPILCMPLMRSVANWRVTCDFWFGVKVIGSQNRWSSPLAVLCTLAGFASRRALHAVRLPCSGSTASVVTLVGSGAGDAALVAWLSSLPWRRRSSCLAGSLAQVRRCFLAGFGGGISSLWHITAIHADSIDVPLCTHFHSLQRDLQYNK